MFFCLNEILSVSMTFLNSLQSSAAVRSSDWLKIEASNWSRIDCVFVTFVTLLSNYNYYVTEVLRNGDLFTRGVIHYVWLIWMIHSASFITWIGVFTVTMVQVPNFFANFWLKNIFGDHTKNTFLAPEIIAKYSKFKL